MTDNASSEEPALLYHYTSRDAALGSILPNRLFRFSAFGDMRGDPFEYRDWSFGASGFIGDSEGDDVDLRYFEMDAIANQVKRRARLAAFCVDGDDGAVSNPHGWSRASMWQHYGEVHKGVCLVFDRARLTAAIVESLAKQGLPSPYFKHVRYELDFRSDPIFDVSQSTIRMNSDDLRQFVHKFVQDSHESLFFRKARDWSNEQEYRFVVTAPDEFDAPVEVDFKDSLVQIIVGDQYPDWAVPGTLEIAEALGVTAKKVGWLGSHCFTAELKPTVGWAG